MKTAVAPPARWRSTSKKTRRKASSFWVDRLDQLAEVRAPFLGCHRALLDRVARAYLPGDGQVVEIGAGSGQLRHWSNDVLNQRWVHTEPDGAALQRLVRQFPTAKVAASSADKLPFADGVLSGAFGLCVFDMLDDLQACFTELTRVLRPGAHVIHLLDLTPSHRAHFRELAQAGRVPLPNLFTDLSSQKWPEDLLVFELEPILRLLQELKAATHPLPHIFGSYFDGYRLSQFDLEKSLSEYDSYTKSLEVQRLLDMALTSAYEIGFRSGAPAPPATAVSSGRHLSQRLARAADRAGLQVEVNDVWTTWTHETLSEGTPLYRNLVLGQECCSPALPRRFLASDVETPSAGRVLREVGVLVFVARRP